MDHVRPDFQRHRRVSGPCNVGETNAVVKECLRRAHLNQEWRHPREIGIYWRSQRRAGIGAIEIGRS